jgi:hypothetical protein
MNNVYRYCGTKGEIVDIRMRLATGALVAILSSLSMHGQVLGQPGQPAIETARASGVPEVIRISETGELVAPVSTQFRPAASIGDRSGQRSAMVWKISIATVVGASVWDAASSYGKREGNPLLRSADGTFGGKGIAMKAGLTGALLIPQYMFRNQKNLRKIFTVMNFVNTGALTAVAAHNMGIRGPK